MAHGQLHIDFTGFKKKMDNEYILCGPIEASGVGKLPCIVAVVARSEFGLFVLLNSPT